MKPPQYDSGYLSYGDDASRRLAMASMARGLDRVEPVVRRHAAASDAYFNVAPNNVSVRDGFSRKDYEGFRPDEAGAASVKGLVRESMCAYDSVGIIRNTIDLMSDFAVRGLDLVHRNERIEKFYREWFRRVGGEERSERFLNLLYRCGNVIIKRQTAYLGERAEKDMRRAAAAAVPAPPALKRREIPWRYTFLNPLSVELEADHLAPLIGADSFRYSVRLPGALARKLARPRTEAERVAREALPPDIRAALDRGEYSIPLDSDKLAVFHYKRDDWKPWATPMLAPILNDLAMLKKMKLADLAALDGAISSIRVWKLGSLEAKIMPTESTILRLAEMLSNNVGGGVMDLVWGPDIDLLETSTAVHQFLGDTKYAPVLNAILQGLGIPQTMSGAVSQSSFTNHYVSLKTLVERLEYGRSLLRAFWEAEVRLVQQAMGFRHPAQVVFDSLLTDETAEKQLLIHLWDRDLVSDEYMQEVFGAVPEIERVRVRRERRKRQRGQMSPKASPYHDANFEGSVKKIYAQSGAYAPSEFGVVLEERRPGEKPPAEARPQGPAPDGAVPGTPGEGRPRGARDGQKRKRKVSKPRRSMAFVADCAWAEDALATIGSLTAPSYLRALGKSTLRELTAEEAGAFEEFKFATLCTLPVGGPVGREELGAVLAGDVAVPAAVAALVREASASYARKHGKDPTIERLRRFRCAAYALLRGQYEESSPAGDAVPALPRAGDEPAG